MKVELFPALVGIIFPTFIGLNLGLELPAHSRTPLLLVMIGGAIWVMVRARNAPRLSNKAIWICGLLLGLLVYDQLLRISRAPGREFVGTVIGEVTAVGRDHLLLHGVAWRPFTHGSGVERLRDDEAALFTAGRRSLLRLYRPQASWKRASALICQLRLKSTQRLSDRAAAIHFHGSAKVCEPTLLPLGSTGSWWTRKREQLSKRMAELSEPASGVMKALVLGQKKGVRERERLHFQHLGLSHIIVVSGLHLGMIALFLYYGVTLLGRGYLLIAEFIPALSRWYERSAVDLPLLAQMVTMVGLTFYLFIVGPQPSLIRAYLFAMLIVGALLWRRPFEPLQLLSLTGIIAILYEPLLLVSVSFQLTMAATFGVLAAVDTLHRRSRLDSDGRRWLPLRWLENGLTVSVYATLTTAPLVLYHFGQLSVWGPLTNLFFTPLTGWAILPLSVGGLVLDELSGALGWLSSLAAPMLETAHWLTTTMLAAAAWLVECGLRSWTLPLGELNSTVRFIMALFGMAYGAALLRWLPGLGELWRWKH